MPKPLDSWASTGVRLVIDHQLLKGMVLNASAIPTGVLDAIDATELASGFNSTTVARNRTRRSHTRRVFFTTKGVSIGALSANVLGGPRYALTWRECLTKTAWLRPFAQYSALSATIDTSAVAGRQRAAWVTSLGLNVQNPKADNSTKRRALGSDIFKHFTGFSPTISADGVETGAVRNLATATWPYMRAQYNTLITDATKGIMFFVVDLGTAGSASDYKVAYIVYDKPAWFPFSAIGIFPGYSSSNLENDGGLKYASLRPQLLIGEPGFKNLVGDATGYGYTAAGGGWITTLSLAADSTFPAQEAPYDTASGAIVAIEKQWVPPTLVAPMPGGDALGLPGISARSGVYYDVGSPEFMDDVHIIGNSEWNPFTRKLTIASASLGFGWSGARLTSITGTATDVSSNDLTAMSTLRVSSFWSNGARKSDATLIDKLAIAAYDEGDLRSQVLFPADSSRGATAITFDQAEKRSVGRDATLVHALASGGPPLDLTNPVYDVYVGVFLKTADGSREVRGKIVKVSDGSAVDITVYIGNSGLTDFTLSGPVSDDMWDAVSKLYYNSLSPRAITTPGGYTIDGSLSLTYALGTIWGIRLQEVVMTSATVDNANAIIDQAELEFREDMMFMGAVPDSALLTDGERAGFYLTQFARPRTQLSNVVIAGVLAGKNSLKRLITI